jgi:hypothetical protein
MSCVHGAAPFGTMPLAGLLVAWVVARFKSVPGVVARALATVLFGWLDMASDVYTINALFGLGHNGAAYALLTMVGVNVAMQVVYSAPMRCLPACAAGRGQQGHWTHRLVWSWLRRRFLRS